MKETTRAEFAGKKADAPKDADAQVVKPIVPKSKVYWDTTGQCFWVRNQAEEWQRFDGGSVRRLLKSWGYWHTAGEGVLMSPLDRELLRVQMVDTVHFAGELAGYQKGMYEMGGSRILITRGPNLITPKKGPWPTLRTFLTSLLKPNANYFLAWLKSSLESLQKGAPWRPGHLLAVAGPPGSGKSLLQALITYVLGGRVSKPYQYLTGETNFNAELFAAEHQAIEDEASSTDIKSRRHFGAMLKNVLVNPVQRIHAKGRQAVHLTPFVRLSITLNEEAENLMVLPPIEEDLAGKIILLKAAKAKLPDESKAGNDRAKIWKMLTDEVPAFLFAMNTWKVPAEYYDRRFGAAAFADPDLLGSLNDLAPEYKLLHLIDTLKIVSLQLSVWEGTATELECELREKDKSGEVGRVLSWSSACGVYLARLAAKAAERVTIPDRKSNSNLYRITGKPRKV